MKKTTKGAGALRHIKRAALSLYCMFICGGLAASWALPYAWSERGYRGGIGGEWLLIICATWLGLELAEKFRKIINL